MEGHHTENHQLALLLVGIVIISSHFFSFCFTRTQPRLSWQLPVGEIAALNRDTNNNFGGGKEEIENLGPLLFQPMHLNKASTELLATIPGLGPHLAQQIRSYILQNGPIIALSDLLKVKGIGRQKVDQMSHYAIP